MGFCTPKSAQRMLIVDNIIIFFVGFIFLIIGGISLANGQNFKLAVGTYCRVECKALKCSEKDCSSRLPSCDCTHGDTSMGGYFYAPASGLISVGVFSLITSVLGCLGAIKPKAALLCGYILAVTFVLVLQLSFGAAAAAVASMSHLPENMRQVFDHDYKDFNWIYLENFLPEACYAATTTHIDEMKTFHPACSWEGKCDPGNSKMPKDALGKEVNCCGEADECNFNDKRYCTSNHRCVSGFLKKVGTPVAVAALLTLVLEVGAISWACVIRRETRPGGQFEMKSLRPQV